jgi:protein-L-isoaspartate(D-aspartate) O-methyltransferase
MALSTTQAARMMMVDSQVRPNKVTDPALISAMRQLPREDFLPATLAARAYADEPVRLGDDRVMLEPMVLARMIQMAGLRPGERVLVVGSGCGYGAALIAMLGCVVTALEDHPALLAVAEAALRTHTTGITLATGPLNQGWPDSAPYDCIFIEGGVEELPTALTEQLSPHGRLVMLRSSGGRVGHAVIGRLSGGAVSFVAEFDCAVTTLPSLRRVPAFVF